LDTEIRDLSGYVDIFRRMPGRMPEMFLQRREIAVESTRGAVPAQGGLTGQYRNRWQFQHRED
jgi:hypothetical protein